MNTHMEGWLRQLNQVSQRTYAIRQEGETFYLVMPNGGTYPPATARETVERLVNITLAAEGRTR